MKTLLIAAAIGAALTATPALAQDRSEVRPATPAKDEVRPDPNASPNTGGDTRPSAVDPAQSTTTGANVGEGASYNRSTEKGDSSMRKEGADKDKK
jgi:hypothetical protein